MKKSTFWNLMLMLLPIGAVGLATTNNSVLVFNPQTGVTDYYSYFELAQVGAVQMAAPMAAMLSLLTGILAAVYLGRKKAGCLKGAAVTAFLSATFAALPILIPGELKVIPNVFLPILMLAEALIAYVRLKKPLAEEKTHPG